MEKRLQFIKHNASVALSLFLLLINQLAAQAGTCSDKTAWLTNNLEEADKTNSQTSLKALTAQQDSLQKTNSIIVNCPDDPNRTIKLRPFVPNRRLPSRSDLALIEQKAKLAEENNSRLNGQISTFVGGDSPSASDCAVKIVPPICQRSTQSNNGNRSYIHHIANKSNQSDFSLMRQAEQQLLLNNQQIFQSNLPASASRSRQSLASSPNKPITPGSIQSLSPPALSLTASPSTTSPSPALSPIASPSTTSPSPALSPIASPSTASPSTAMNLPAEELGPSAFSLPTPKIQTQPIYSSFGAAGPPPFPLNLLPESSLKQLVKSLAGKRTYPGDTSRVTFGSWHTTTALNNVSSARLTHLPYAGFQSHLPGPAIRSNKRINSRHRCALPAVTNLPIKSTSNKKRPHDAADKKDPSTRSRMLLESQVRVAVYPAYATQSLKLWNFAQ